MKISTLIAAAALALPTAALAHDGHPHTDHADGQVRKIDRDAGKITLKHGEIKNLDMPPMTMVFQVKDKAVLANVKEGDKVKFTAERVKGAYVVTSLEPAAK